MASSTKPTTNAVAAGLVMQHRLLTAAEINVVRQFEMRTDDRLVKVRLENNVGRR